MAKKKAEQIYDALGCLNRWMCDKYQKQIETGEMDIPHCKNVDEVKDWANHIISIVPKQNIKVCRYYNRRPFECKLTGMPYWEAITLLNLILQDEHLSESNCDIQCGPNSMLHWLARARVGKSHYGRIIVSYSFRLIIITVKRNQSDVDIRFCRLKI